MNESFAMLPANILPISEIFRELNAFSQEGLADRNQEEFSNEETKGLKFIANKLIKLFDKHTKLAYNHVTRVLIENFTSEKNDRKNVKRRVYDALNVLVAANVLTKQGDFLVKTEDRRQTRSKVKDEQRRRRTDSVENKKKQLKRLKERLEKIKAIQARKQSSVTSGDKRISSPQMCLLEGTSDLKGYTLERIDTHSLKLTLLRLNRSGCKAKLVRTENKIEIDRALGGSGYFDFL